MDLVLCSVAVVEMLFVVLPPEGVLGDPDDEHHDASDNSGNTQVGHGVADLSFEVGQTGRGGDTLLKVKRVVEQGRLADAGAGVLTLQVTDDLHPGIDRGSSWDFQIAAGGSSAACFLCFLSGLFNLLEVLVANLESGVRS